MVRLTAIWQNTSVVDKAKSTLNDLIKRASNGIFQVEEAKIVFSSTPLVLSTLGLIRVNNEDRTDMMVIGTCDSASASMVEGLNESQTKLPNPDENFGIEKRILQDLEKSLLPFFEQLGIVRGTKSLSSISGDSLLGWKTLEFKKSLKFLVTSKDKAYSIHIPLLEDGERDEIAVQAIGFSEKAKFLLIDDSPVMRSFSRSILSAYGFLNIVECADGVEAVTELNNPGQKADLLIVDWHMPKMNGLQLLQLVRSSDNFKGLPVLMVTGEQNKPEVIKAIKSGVSGYIVKPYDALILMNAIQKIGRSQSGQSLRKV